MPVLECTENSCTICAACSCITGVRLSAVADSVSTNCC